MYHSINNCSTIDMIGRRVSTTSSAYCSSQFKPHVRDFYEAAARDVVIPALLMAPLDTQFGRVGLLFNVVAALLDLQDAAYPKPPLGLSSHLCHRIVTTIAGLKLERLPTGVPLLLHASGVEFERTYSKVECCAPVRLTTPRGGLPWAINDRP